MTRDEWQAMITTAIAVWPQSSITPETAEAYYRQYAALIDDDVAAEALQRLALTEQHFPPMSVLRQAVSAIMQQRNDADQAKRLARGDTDGDRGPYISLDQYLATPRGEQQLQSNEFLQRYVAHKQKGASTDNAFASAMQRPTPSPN